MVFCLVCGPIFCPVCGHDVTTYAILVVSGSCHLPFVREVSTSSNEDRMTRYVCSLHGLGSGPTIDSLLHVTRLP